MGLGRGAVDDEMEMNWLQIFLEYKEKALSNKSINGMIGFDEKVILQAVSSTGEAEWNDETDFGDKCDGKIIINFVEMRFWNDFL